MHVHVQMMRPADDLRTALLRDGWQLVAEHPRGFSVSHPLVSDGEGARARLNRLGLLTSPRLRIDFDRPPR
jgi:hypothetical protein